MEQCHIYYRQKGKTIDLIQNFSKVSLDFVKLQAKQLWDSPDSEIQCHTRGTATYNARLFDVFLLNSLTPDFVALLFGRIGQTYQMDGPLLFLTMSKLTYVFFRKIYVSLHRQGMRKLRTMITTAHFYATSVHYYPHFSAEGPQMATWLHGEYTPYVSFPACTFS
jgi:hypothetical protein